MNTPVPKPTRLHWITLALLIVSVGISYIDRGNLGVAAKSIEAELRFPQDQLGVLLGGFFWTYSLMQILAGKLIDRWNVNWVLAAGYLLWSVATGLTGLVSGFGVLFALRLILGIGESVSYPAYSKIIALYFPEQLRGAANGLIDAGSKLGPAIGVLLGVRLVNWLSWRGMFIAIGAASLLWLVPWCFIAFRLQVQQRNIASISGPAFICKAPTYRELLSKRGLWGTMLGLFGANYTWYLLLTWAPYYFENDRHYTHERLAILGSLPFWAVAASASICGFVTDALVRRGRDAGSVRRGCVALGLLFSCGFLLPAVLIREDILSNTLFTLACISFGLFSSNHWALTQTLAGPEAAGKWTGLENCVGNFAGVVAPYVSGLILRETHSFLAAFAIACGFLLLGLLGFTVVVGKPDRVSWTTETHPRMATYI
jgi:MFS transporter, ACS family, D-galactonate transporter